MRWTKSFLCLAVAAIVLTSGTVLAGERVAVARDIANVRAQPSTTSDTLWQVEKYHPLQVLEKRGQWYRFKDFEGDIGWIHSSLVDKTPTVIVRVRRANVRTGPGTQYDLAFDAEKGTPFKVLETKGRWKKIRHADGDEGWIFNSLVW
ncbi:MAG: SH3 domain-containing protein [Desulfobacteraceae bacterium]|jgi:SH3-like domain-containing protein